MAEKTETDEEKVIREAAELKASNTAPAAKQPVAKGAGDGKEDAKAFEGQVISTDHFTITTGDNLGRPLVNVLPVGYVGDAPLVISGWKLKDLISALGKVKNLPKEPAAPSTDPYSTGGDE